MEATSLDRDSNLHALDSIVLKNWLAVSFSTALVKYKTWVT